MPIACTRCGQSEDGEILTAPIAFTFKHGKGCGHGIGPLCVIKGKTPKNVELKDTEKPKEKEKEKEKKEKKKSPKKDKPAPWSKSEIQNY